MSFGNKFLIGLGVIAALLFSVLFIVNFIKGLIDDGKGPLLIIILLVLTICYPTGNYILSKISK